MVAHTRYAVMMVICRFCLPWILISDHLPIPLGSTEEVALEDHGWCIIMHVPPGRYEVLLSGWVQQENV